MIAISSNLRIKKKARAHSMMYMIRGATLKRSQKWRRKLLEYRTRKVRRSVINTRYKDIINDLYSDKDIASINTEFTLEDGRKSKISAKMEIKELIKTAKAKKSAVKVKKSSKGKK